MICVIRHVTVTWPN